MEFERADNHAVAKHAHGGEVEARVVEVEAEGVRPVDAGAPCRDGLLVGQACGTLEHGNEGEAPGSLGRLAAG
jgi:hypothetical protein